jgi:large subunit ribosomal protein LP0
MDTKRDFMKRVFTLAGKYKQIIVVTVENVTSSQIQSIRRIVYKTGGCLIVGKNTIIKKALQLRAANELPEEFKDFRSIGPSIPELTSLLPLIKNKIGLVFSDESVFELKPKLETFKIQAAAKLGATAPIDVIIPPGTTGMDPSQIGFFHALQISTKIDKGMIAITKDYQVCFAGKKIGSSQVALLQKMGLKPFMYGMTVQACYDDGSVLDQNVLSINTDALVGRFQTAVKNVAAISLNLGYPTTVSVPHSVVNAFKNLAAIGLQINYKFAQIANAGAAPAAAPAAGKPAAAAKVEAPKKEAPPPPPAEEEDAGMGDLFG